MTTTTTDPAPTTHSGSRATRIRNRVLVVLSAALAASLGWAVAIPLLGVDVTVPAAPGSTDRVDLALGAVIGAAILASLAGWALLAVLERFTRRAYRTWTIVAVGVFLVTLPLAPGFTGAERIVLGLLHAAVAGVVIPLLPRAGAR